MLLETLVQQVLQVLKVLQVLEGQLEVQVYKALKALLDQLVRQEYQVKQDLMVVLWVSKGIKVRKVLQVLQKATKGQVVLKVPSAPLAPLALPAPLVLKASLVQSPALKEIQDPLPIMWDHRAQTVLRALAVAPKVLMDQLGYHAGIPMAMASMTLVKMPTEMGYITCPIVLERMALQGLKALVALSALLGLRENEAIPFMR